MFRPSLLYMASKLELKHAIKPCTMPECVGRSCRPLEDFRDMYQRLFCHEGRLRGQDTVPYHYTLHLLHAVQLRVKRAGPVS